MSYSPDRPVHRYVGWKISDNLIECSFHRDAPKKLCVEFRYVVLHDGVEIPQKSVIHRPESIVLTQDDLYDASPRSTKNIMRIEGPLLEQADAKFRGQEMIDVVISPSADVIQMPQSSETQPRKLAMGG